jgi:hypothetical protein
MQQPLWTAGDIVIQDHSGSFVIVRVTSATTSVHIAAEASFDAAKIRACQEALGRRVWLVKVPLHSGASEAHELVRCPGSPGA